VETIPQSELVLLAETTPALHSLVGAKPLYSRKAGNQKGRRVLPWEAAAMELVAEGTSINTPQAYHSVTIFGIKGRYNLPTNYYPHLRQNINFSNKLTIKYMLS
jgi:hypothetical protein